MQPFLEINMPFDARVFHSDGETIVAVSGEIDMASGDRLWAVLEEAISSTDRLIIDLAQTTFIDSSGLAVLIRAHRQLGEIREAVVVRSPSPAARRLLNVSGLDQVLTIQDP